MNKINANEVSEEIKEAFRVNPRPERWAYFNLYEEETDRLNYLVDRTWLEVADQPKFLKDHEFDDFSLMSAECFLYFFPGYLLGIVSHPSGAFEQREHALLLILEPEKLDYGDHLFEYLLAKLTPDQKKAVAHFLQLLLERDEEAHPKVYERGMLSQQLLAFDKWQEWA